MQVQGIVAPVRTYTAYVMFHRQQEYDGDNHCIDEDCRSDSRAVSAAHPKGVQSNGHVTDCTATTVPLNVWEQPSSLLSVAAQGLRPSDCAIGPAGIMLSSYRTNGYQPLINRTSHSETEPGIVNDDRWYPPNEWTSLCMQHCRLMTASER